MKLIIGNRAYSSWSMRGWLACKQSGLEFEELVVPMFDENWEKRREGDEFAPSLGKVPVLWDGDCVVWDSLAIIDFLADRVGRDLFWPADESARGMARSMAAEMHSGFANLRRDLPMNVRKNYGSVPLSEEVEAEIVRILNLWAQARARFGGSGEYLFGDWCAADIMFAPVVTRFVTYGVKIPPFAATYMENVLHRGDVVEWIELAQEEPWVIEQYEENLRQIMLSRALRSLCRYLSVGPSAEQVDVGIMAILAAIGPDDEEAARRSALVDQVMPVCDVLGNAATSPTLSNVRPSSSTSTASPSIITSNSSSPSCQCRWLDQAPGSSRTRLAPKSVIPLGGASRRYQRPATSRSNGGG